MASFYRATVEQFLGQTDEHVIARLAVAYANRGYTSQYTDLTLAWARDLSSLRQCLATCVANSDSAKTWGILLEFSIPRKESRIDVVLLVKETVVVVEAKTGPTTLAAERQVEEYALLLHYFHKASASLQIIPIAVSPIGLPTAVPDLDPKALPPLPGHWVSKAVRCSWISLPGLLMKAERSSNEQLGAENWGESPYFPIPTIIEAAMALKGGLTIREIAHSEASEAQIEQVRATIQGYVDESRSASQHTICFVTGVPGSGKTLVGLSVAHSDQNRSEAIHFMSGNGPLVKVLQHLFIQESRSHGTSTPQAKTEAKTLIENVHVFAKYYTEDEPGPPANHAIIFDEAQRAWNRTQNKKKFGRDYSEPEMLLRIMERHDDWATVVALVGGGQEINDGEAGLEEWGKALSEASKPWVVYASEEVLEGGASTAGHRLFQDPAQKQTVRTSNMLHLRTSNRSLRADKLAVWVNHVLDGLADDACSLAITKTFPILLSRSLEEVRTKLNEYRIGATRFGLTGSSGAARLRAEGLEPNSTFHADYPWHHWYLSEKGDVRSSFQCEVFATEFEIQGLELDWTGLCWGGDFVWHDTKGWELRALRHGSQSKWKEISNAEKRIYKRNAYRVLLTRARQGMIIFVPQGNSHDPTNRRDEFDATANFLLRCGVVDVGSL